MPISRSELWQPITGGPRRFTRQQYLQYLRDRRAIRMSDHRWRLARRHAEQSFRAMMQSVSTFPELAQGIEDHSWALRILTSDPAMTVSNVVFVEKTEINDRQIPVRMTFDITMTEMVIMNRKDNALRTRYENLDLPINQSLRRYRTFYDAMSLFELTGSHQIVGGRGAITGSISKKTIPGIIVMRVMCAPNQYALT